MFNTIFWLKKIQIINDEITKKYDKSYGNISFNILREIILTAKQLSIDILSYDIKFLDQQETNTKEYSDGLYALILEGIENLSSSSTNVFNTLISIKSNRIEWAIISNPFNKKNIIFNGNTTSCAHNSFNTYDLSSFSKGILNGIDFYQVEYQKFMNFETIITRNSSYILELILTNKIKYGVISKNKINIINNMYTLILKKSKIDFKEYDNYFLIYRK